MTDRSIYQQIMLDGMQQVIDVTPTLTVHAGYVANDYVGESAVPMTFANVARKVGGGGRVWGAMLIDAVVASVAAELWLFDTAVTPPADSAAWSISDAHAARCIGVIPFSTYYASALNSVSFGVPDKPIFYECLAASQSIYGCLVTRGAPAYAATGDVKVRLYVTMV